MNGCGAGSIFAGEEFLLVCWISVHQASRDIVSYGLERSSDREIVLFMTCNLFICWMIVHF